MLPGRTGRHTGAWISSSFSRAFGVEKGVCWSTFRRIPRSSRTGWSRWVGKLDDGLLTVRASRGVDSALADCFHAPALRQPDAEDQDGDTARPGVRFDLATEGQAVQNGNKVQ